GRGALRLEPAAVLDALARPGAGRHSGLPRARDLADRLVTARAGRAHGEVQARRAAARRDARYLRLDGRLHGARSRPAAARARAAAAPGGRRARPLDGPARARLGAARGERRL